jgi:hypothetical protein
MRYPELCHELAKHVSASFGASPGGVGKVGLSHEELKSDKFKIQDDDNQIRNVDVWYGETMGAMGNMVAMLTSIKENEFVIVIGFKNDVNDFEDSTILGFKFNWNLENDTGNWLLFNEDKWLEIDLMRKLQLSMGMEAMVQEGSMWMPGTAPEKLRECLISLIEVDEGKGT